VTAPMPPAGLAALVAWLGEHRAAFTEEALRTRLLEAGHPPGDVEAAFEVLRGEPDHPSAGSVRDGAESRDSPPSAIAGWPPARIPEAEVKRQRDAVLAFLGALLAIVGIPLLLTMAGAVVSLVPVIIGLLVLAFIVWAGLRGSSHPGVAAGLGAALLVVVVLPVVAVVAVFGFCLVTGGRLN
jgi:hypothetical protein